MTVVVRLSRARRRIRRAISTAPKTRATRANEGKIGGDSLDNTTCPCGTVA